MVAPSMVDVVGRLGVVAVEVLVPDDVDVLVVDKVTAVVVPASGSDSESHAESKRSNTSATEPWSKHDIPCYDAIGPASR
jgi:hypothetical protein